MMNPKDEVKFEDIKKLVNAALEKFYKSDRDLIEMSDEQNMISERCMVFHIGGYMKNKMGTLAKFHWADLDCEYNRDMENPKRIYEDRFTPDLIIHRRRSNKNNLLVIEFKKQYAPRDEKEYDRRKLIHLTEQDGQYKYNYGLYIELGRHDVYVDVYQEGSLQTKLNYSITY